jgi:hypothetical protein
MATFSFADRYAEAGLSPSADIIIARQAPADRILGKIDNVQLLDLVGTYYGSPGLNLTWLRDQFAQEDASFSLVNNERECRVLSAAMLGALVSDGNPKAILAVIAGHVVRKRGPSEAVWLVSEAQAALEKLAVAARIPKTIGTKLTPTQVPKLAEEIPALAANDWPAMLATLTKVRNESQSSIGTTSAQASKALDSMNHEIRLLREESQMLWWLFGGHSRTLRREFASFAPAQAALVGAVDLGALTSVTQLGPVAAPVMLERVIALAKGPRVQSPKSLASAIDTITREDLDRLKVFPDEIPARIAPVTAAIMLARTIGIGVWHSRFLEITGLDASIELEPIELAEQLYREILLGRLL